MKVNQAEFVISAVGPSQYPSDALPEIALAGRSNVGKSSLINRMINRKNLARTSSKPGKTQQLNYYRINTDLFFCRFARLRLCAGVQNRTGKVGEVHRGVPAEAGIFAACAAGY